MTQENTNSIYIRVPGGFGDNLMATPLIEAIANENPYIRIFVCTKREELFNNNPHIAAVYNTRTLLKKNRSIYDRCSVLEYPSYPFHREAAQPKHYIDFFYDCIPLKIESRSYQPKLYLTQKERNYKHAKLQKIKRPMVVVSPYGGATSKIPNKFYPKEKWPDIVRGLLKEGINVIQLGRKKEGPVFEGALDFRNIGYRKSAAILLHSDLLITHPSGFMHLATAVKTPCMTLFSGTEDPLAGGYQVNPDLTVELECAPCWLEKPCDDPKCKELLSPEKVVASAVKFIESNTYKPHNR